MDFRVKVRCTPYIIEDGLRSKAAACAVKKRFESTTGEHAVVQFYDAGSADDPGDWFATKCSEPGANRRRR